MMHTRRHATRHPKPPLESGLILRDVPLAPHTTFRIGGPARYLAQPKNRSQFAGALRWALSRSISFFVMGGGANVLVHDQGFDGLVILTTGLDRVEFKESKVLAHCGVSVDHLADRCARQGLSGMEFAGGLPGTLGGALFMNARAYGGEFSRIVEQVEALTAQGDAVHSRKLTRDDLGFSYKKSRFQAGNLYVYRALLQLSPDNPDRIQEQTKINRNKRREAGQYRFPNAGCVFKNNYRVGTSTGRLIDQLGLKGVRIGDAEVSSEHGNFIVNRGSASAADVFRLIRLVESTVHRERGVTLQREIVLLGNWREEGQSEG